MIVLTLVWIIVAVVWMGIATDSFHRLDKWWEYPAFFSICLLWPLGGAALIWAMYIKPLSTKLLRKR